MYSHFLPLALATLAISAATASPTPQQWAALNQTLGGRLHKPTLPFALCHPSQPNYNLNECKAIASQYKNSTFVSSQPVSFDYNDQGCLPNPSLPCNYSFYPAYFVNATTAQHVQSAVNFARQNKVRLVIKSTGHDWNGRSTAPGALSIWTHYLRTFEVHNSFKPQGCAGCQAHSAITLGAGLQLGDIYAQAAQHGLIVVGGAGPDVGVGGFLGGGGHGPLTRVYGLGADNVLEMQVVTASGQILTVNQVQNSDLFWALRGGGASTFAVAMSYTVNSFPTPRITAAVFGLNTTANSPAFWDAATYFHSQLPAISDAGLMGYYYIVPDSPPQRSQGFNEPGGLVAGILYSLNSTPNATLSKLQSLQTYANNHNGSAFLTQVTSYPTFHEFYVDKITLEGVGLAGRLGSRLLGRTALTGNQSQLNAALRTAGTGITLLGHLVAGKGVQNAKPAGGSDAVLPAWRTTIAHLVAPAIWPFFNKTAQTDVSRRLTYTQIEALRQLDPNSGAYASEGDPCEPNWQTAFYGANYARLLSIKNKWDPSRVFQCFPCVAGDQSTVQCPSK